MNHAARIGIVLDFAEPIVRVVEVHIIVRNRKVRVVEQIEKLESELNLGLLRYRRILENRQISVVDRRSAEGVAPKRADKNCSSCGVRDAAETGSVWTAGG